MCFFLILIFLGMVLKSSITSFTIEMVLSMLMCGSLLSWLSVLLIVLLAVLMAELMMAMISVLCFLNAVLVSLGVLLFCWWGMCLWMTVNVGR